MKAAAVQICASSDKEENREKMGHFVKKAAQMGAKWIVLPEHWSWLGPPNEKKENAETLDGATIQTVQAWAKQFGCTIVAGTIAEANRIDPPYNTCAVVLPDGRIGAVYRKIHLFDTDVAGGHRESGTTSPGSEVVVADLEKIKVGLSICYDLRFPELFRRLAARGAEIIAVPSNFTAFTGKAHWEILCRARAIENQCFVIATGQTGVTGAGWEAHGHSMIVDPWGEILAQAGKPEGFISADLNFDRLKEVRAQMPVHSHRKL